MRKILFFSLFHLLLCSGEAVDLFKQHQNITDGGKLESAGGTFVLGFFSTGASKHFLGIWFKVSPQAIVWVANRNSPLKNTSGVLSISENGNLILEDNSNGSVMWYSNSTYTTNPTSVQLLDSGNLVLRDLKTNGVLWQSFDWPTNTFLPGMRVGKNLKTGHEWSLYSWRTSDDPAIGEYHYYMDTHGSPEFGTWDGNQKRLYRTGPWNGVRFSGIPEMTTFQDMFSFSFNNSPDEISYGYSNKPGSFLSRVMLNESGTMQRLVWYQNTSSWSVFWSAPRDQCDYYAKCGVFGVCNANDAMVCSCFNGFEPRSPSGWYMRDTSQGCVRKTKLDCANLGDGFNLVKGVKLPETHSVIVDVTIDLDRCREKCLANCSCVAYSGTDISNGGSGCIMWVNELVDTRFIDGGQDLYIKVALSDLDAGTKNSKTHLAIIISVVVAAFAATLFTLGVYIWKKKPTDKIKVISSTSYNFSENSRFEDSELPLFDMETVMQSTNNFSIINKIGEGGFGSVYKGQLTNGQEIAVKRLSMQSLQGPHEFMNEVLLIAKLQHRNLVRLHGCCIHADERMLVYEYMCNKSLDFFIFDEKRRPFLDWGMRLDIIHGIARGILYLHQDSRFNIIHRDLKAANILLDQEMVPKISDFGTARLFRSDQVEMATQTVVGTRGYMSPEYAMTGTISVKSDVYSFGVLLLEILSGQRNNGNMILLADTWRLWEKGNPLKLLDPTVCGPCPVPDLLRCLHVGLLCVQECPDDRPLMGSVLFMLSSEIAALPLPKKPVICTRINSVQAQLWESSSSYEITITDLEGR
ncbi:receptor-like serine/threonine-protein kinase SD1-8 [Carex rostrata]